MCSRLYYIGLSKSLYDVRATTKSPKNRFSERIPVVRRCISVFFVYVHIPDFQLYYFSWFLNFFTYLLAPDCLRVISSHGEWDEMRVSIALEHMGQEVGH